MDIRLYRQFLAEYVQAALKNSDRTNAGVSAYLWEQKVGGFFTRHKQERLAALADARRAFDEHRHWPQEIVLSHLGLDKK